MSLDGRPVLKPFVIPHQNLEKTGRNSPGCHGATEKIFKQDQGCQTDSVVITCGSTTSNSMEMDQDKSDLHDEYDEYDKCDVDATDESCFTENERNQICELTVRLMERNLQHYTGIPKQLSHVVKLISGKSGVSIPNLFLILRKIRHNESFQILGDSFGISRQLAGKIFLANVEKIAASLRLFIYYAQQSNTTSNVSLQRKDVILQCFEISIGKPSKLLEEALSWSQCKHTTTVKYLIGCTRYGLIIFISEGFLGKITDNEIVRRSGFLDFMKKDLSCRIISDPEFKDIKSDIFWNSTTMPKSSRDSLDDATNVEAKLGRSIGTAKIPIVKVIKKIRNFAFLKPHNSVLSYKRTFLIENAVVIASAICNMHNK